MGGWGFEGLGLRGLGVRVCVSSRRPLSKDEDHEAPTVGELRPSSRQQVLAGAVSGLMEDLQCFFHGVQKTIP